MNDIKKLTPDYFGWILLLLFDICLTLFWLWAIYKGLNAVRNYTFDFAGYSFAFIAAILFIWNTYEIWILVKFLQIELGRTIEFDSSRHKISVSKNKSTQSYLLKDLEEVIFSEQRFNTRTPTAHLSYSQLNFKSSKPLLITSFVINTKDLEKMLGTGGFKRKSRDRKLFEGVRLR